MPSSEQLATNSPRASKGPRARGRRGAGEALQLAAEGVGARTRPLAVRARGRRPPRARARRRVVGEEVGEEAPRRWYFRIGSGASESESESESEESPRTRRRRRRRRRREEDAAESRPRTILGPRVLVPGRRLPSVSYDDEAEEEEEEGATSSSSPSSVGAGAIAARDDAVEGRPANPRRPEARRH